MINKMNKRKILIILIFICALFFVTGCGPDNDNPAEKEEKYIQELGITGEKEVELNKAIVLKASYDEECITDFVWESSDTEIATVSDGVVFGKKDGYVTITLKDNYSKLTETYEIKVGIGTVDLNSFLDWAFEQIGTEGYDEIELPQTYPGYACTFEWSSEDENLFDGATGYLGLVKTDTVCKVTCKVKYLDEELERTIDYTIIGYITDDISKKFLSQFKANKIFHDMSLTTTYEDYGGSTVTWESLNQEIFTNNGILNKPLYESEVKILYTVTTTDPKATRTFEQILIAEPLNNTEKAELIEEWLIKNISPDGKLYKNTVLPDYIDDYDVKLEWLNESGTKLTLDFSVENPILGEGINVTIKFTNKLGSKGQFDMHFNTNEKQITDMWEKIKLFTDTINASSLTTYSYLVISWSSTNLGYLPFYKNDNAEVIVDILPYTDGRVRTNIMKTSTQYIVVHDTGSPSKGADALAHKNYITNLNNSTTSTEYKSWHYTVDDEIIYQHLPLDEVGYHAGDGSTTYPNTWVNGTYNCIGGGNRNGIGIESCVDEGSDYTQTMRNMAKLVAELLIKYNLGFDRIKQHYNFSGKNCPQVMRGSDRWKEFIYLVKLEHYAKTELKGVNFEWTSLSNYMDNEGRITSAQPIGTTCNYKVKVTYNNESKEFNYSSTLSKR